VRVIQQGKHTCESGGSNHVALRTNDTLEKLEEEVNGQQMGVKEKSTLENLGGGGCKKHRQKVPFANRTTGVFTPKEPAFIQHFPQRGILS